MKSTVYLLTGGWGRLGIHLQKLLPNISPTRTDMDILDPRSVGRHIRITRPKAVVHLAAVTDQVYASSHPSEAYAVNVAGTRIVAEAAKQLGTKVFYISTDYVFDGKRGNYMETDTPHPANFYGATKLMGEFEIIRNLKEYCIIRTSFRPIVWDYPTAYTDVFTSADYVDIISGYIADVIYGDIQGIIHVGTPKKSLYNLAKQRNPDIRPEICAVDMPKNRHLNIQKWTHLKKQRTKKQ